MISDSRGVAEIALSTSYLIQPSTNHAGQRYGATKSNTLDIN